MFAPVPRDRPSARKESRGVFRPSFRWLLDEGILAARRRVVQIFSVGAIYSI